MIIMNFLVVMLSLIWTSIFCESAYLYTPKTASDNNDGDATSLLEKFALQEYHRHQCFSDLRDRIMNFYRPYVAQADMMYLLGVPNHFNLGDRLLTYGELKLMSSLDRKFNRLFSLEATITRCSEILMAHQNSNRKVLIFYQSGGNWGDLYFKDEHGPRMRCFQTLYNQTRNSHLNVQVISMQQSIFFEDTTNAIPDDDFFQSIQIPDFFQLAVRQFDSYDMALELYPSLHPNNIHLLPDNAFMVDPVHFNQYTPIVDVLILMRVDGEAVLHTSEKLKLQQKLQDAGITFRFTDWNLLDKDEINAFDATNGDPELLFHLMAKILSQGKILIVDRLHACIGSMLIGKRVIFVDQSYLKINRTLSTAFATSTSCTLENMRISRAENADDAFNQAVKELNTKQYFN